VSIFQGLLFLCFGLGLLLVVFKSLTNGRLPCGPNGLKGRLEFHRAAQPFLYWLMFVLYTVAGLWLIIFAARLLTGAAQPLPLN